MVAWQLRMVLHNRTACLFLLSSYLILGLILRIMVKMKAISVAHYQILRDLCTGTYQLEEVISAEYAYNHVQSPRLAHS